MKSRTKRTDEPTPRGRLLAGIESLLERGGEWISWIWLILLAVIIVNVVLRYVFGLSLIHI